MRTLSISLLLAATGCAPRAAPAPRPLPVMPPDAVLVPAGADLQARSDAAAAGSALRLGPGVHQGPVVVRRRLVLCGPSEAVIRGDGAGTTLRLDAAGAQLLGCTIDGSGQRFEQLDSAVRVAGDDVRVEGVQVVGALFGILVERASRVHIVGNTVTGSSAPALGLRGDAIRLWEVTDSEVRDNVVSGSRDVVVWYSSRNRICGNVVSGGRYGTHFMYSHDCALEDNRYVGGVVGCFVMYCRGVSLRRNVMARAAGAAGIGIGVKESGDLVVEDNWLLANTTGVYLDTSPLDLQQHNRFARNTVALCETGVAFHASPRRNTFVDNSFADNGAVVKVGGGGDALASDWQGNHFDVYRGYDLDGDGRGDVAFEFRRLSTQLEGRFPQLALLHGAPAMQMLDVVAELMPLLQPQPLLRDGAPRLQPPGRWQPRGGTDAR